MQKAHLFADLPKAMIDPAFLDRLHYYLPGWETPKLEARLFTNHFGFVSDYFAEALRRLRKQSFVRKLDEEFALGTHLSARDEKAVRKTVSGLLKILHPHGEWTRTDLREYLEFALEGRRRVKEQLKKLAPHDYAKTAFSYIERDSGRELWVEVPEQPDDQAAGLNLHADSAEQIAKDSDRLHTVELSTEQLIELGESKHVEFKQTARVNSHTNRRDPVMEQMVVKTVAAFMNTEGGTLLIGVADSGEVTGLHADLKTLGKKQNIDGFELWLNRLLDNALGPTTATTIQPTFEEHQKQLLCRLDVRPVTEPAFVGSTKGEAEFYIRLGNSTRRLNTAEALEYIHIRWI